MKEERKHNIEFMCLSIVIHLPIIPPHLYFHPDLRKLFAWYKFILVPSGVLI